jgi:hypothetical protein
VKPYLKKTRKKKKRLLSPFLSCPWPHLKTVLELGVLFHACNRSTWEVELRRTVVQGQFWQKARPPISTK